MRAEREIDNLLLMPPLTFEKLSKSCDVMHNSFRNTDLVKCLIV